MIGRGDVLDDLTVEDSPGRAGRGEVANRRGGKASGGQHGPHHAANMAGGAIDADIEFPAHHSASSLNASWRATTALSTSSSRMTQVMRMADVEIISMLMPASASVSNIVADTPACVFIPAPTS